MAAAMAASASTIKVAAPAAASSRRGTVMPSRTKAAPDVFGVSINPPTRFHHLSVRASSSTTEEASRKKTGAELREEFFLAAATGKERGLPEGSFLNDNVISGELVEITWEPYGDTCSAFEGSSLLKAAVDAGSLKIDNRFCLTGQCDVCIVEMEGGEVVRSCMVPVPKGKKKMTCLVLDTDDAWDEMVV